MQPGAGDIAGQGDDGGADEEWGDHQGNGLQAAGKEGAQVSLVSVKGYRATHQVGARLG